MATLLIFQANRNRVIAISQITNHQSLITFENLSQKFDIIYLNQIIWDTLNGLVWCMDTKSKDKL